MPSTTAFRPGEVILVPFVFSDMSAAKRRPAVVVSSATYHADRPDAVIMAITSQASPLAGDVKLIDWSEAGLIRASYLKAVVQTISQRAIYRTLGHLSAGDFAAAQASLRNILDL